MDEGLYVVTYDISDQKRWRKVFKTMEGYGHWIQLSVFQCRLTARRRSALAMRLERLIKRGDDHILILNIGPADKVELRVESLGTVYEATRRQAVVV